jgi:hypothetical protein
MTIDLRDPRQLTRVLARSRLIMGLTAVVLPRLGGSLLGVTPRSGPARFYVRAAGIRDALIGLGMEMSVREGRYPQGWVGIAGVADAGDALAALVTRGLTKRGRMLSLFATGSAVVHLQLARQLDELDTAETDLGAAPAEISTT